MQERVKYRVSVGGSRTIRDYKTEQMARMYAPSFARRAKMMNSRCDGSYKIHRLVVSPSPEYKIIEDVVIFQSNGNGNQAE